MVLRGEARVGLRTDEVHAARIRPCGLGPVCCSVAVLCSAVCCVALRCWSRAQRRWCRGVLLVPSLCCAVSLVLVRRGSPCVSVVTPLCEPVRLIVSRSALRVASALPSPLLSPPLRAADMDATSATTNSSSIDADRGQPTHGTAQPLLPNRRLAAEGTAACRPQPTLAVGIRRQQTGGSEAAAVATVSLHSNRRTTRGAIRRRAAAAISARDGRATPLLTARPPSATPTRATLRRRRAGGAEMGDAGAGDWPSDVSALSFFCVGVCCPRAVCSLCPCVPPSCSDPSLSASAGRDSQLLSHVPQAPQLSEL